jgi:Tfp pilus assembly protein PilF
MIGHRGLTLCVLLFALALPVTTAAQPGPSVSRSTGRLPTGGATLADLAYGRGVAMLAQGDATAAVRNLRMAVAGRPDSAAYRLALANAYMATGAEDAVHLAVDEYERAIVLEPGLDRAREGLARSAWMVGLSSTALTHMERLFSGSGTVRMQYAAELATFYMLAHDVDRGIATFTRALPAVSDPQPLRLLLAALHMQKSDKKGAQALVQRVLADAKPGSPMAVQAQRMLQQGIGR